MLLETKSIFNSGISSLWINVALSARVQCGGGWVVFGAKPWLCEDQSSFTLGSTFFWSRIWISKIFLRDFDGKDFARQDFGRQVFAGQYFPGLEFVGRDFAKWNFTGRDFAGWDFLDQDFAGWDYKFRQKICQKNSSKISQKPQVYSRNLQEPQGTP